MASSVSKYGGVCPKGVFDSNGGVFAYVYSIHCPFFNSWKCKQTVRDDYSVRSATRSVNEQAADGLNCSGSKWLPLDGQELQFGDLLDKLHWSLEFAVQADLAVTLGEL